MYTVLMTNTFGKDVARCKKRGYDMSLLNRAIHLLAATGTLPVSYRPHKLSGNLAGVLGMPSERGLAIALETK